MRASDCASSLQVACNSPIERPCVAWTFAMYALRRASSFVWSPKFRAIAFVWSRTSAISPKWRASAFASRADWRCLKAAVISIIISSGVFMVDPFRPGRVSKARRRRESAGRNIPPHIFFPPLASCPASGGKRLAAQRPSAQPSPLAAGCTGHDSGTVAVVVCLPLAWPVLSAASFGRSCLSGVAGAPAHASSISLSLHCADQGD